MARGKKIPNEIKKLQGTYRSNEAPDNPFIPDGFEGIPDPPEELGKIGKLIWTGTVTELQNKGMLYNIDMPIIHMYCQEYENYQLAEKELATNGRLIEHTNKSGVTNVVPSPWVSIKSKSWEVIKFLSQQFGLTPVSRNKLDMPESKELNELDLLLARS